MEGLFDMGSNYEKIIRKNIEKAFSRPAGELENALCADRQGESFCFTAFGEECRLSPYGITLSGRACNGPRGLLISLYGVHAKTDAVVLEPFKAFKELPDSMPYYGAFSSHSERILVPHVLHMQKRQGTIKKALGIPDQQDRTEGDFSLLLYPFPKIALLYICYMPDDEFPASVTCLFSANASLFMPVDGLADVAEYTSRKIIDLVHN
jgi:hypothetical protein